MVMGRGGQLPVSGKCVCTASSDWEAGGIFFW